VSSESNPPPDLVTINIGNTHTSATAWTLANEIPETVEWQSDFRSMAAVAKYAAPATQILIASVVKQCTSKLFNDLATLNRKPLFFRIDIAPKLQIVPILAERVGDDRIAAALGALDIDATTPWVVVDAGTAVTCNAINPGQLGELPHFEGGVIYPGALLCLKSLNQGTAQLPDLKSSSFENSGFNFIGRSTEQAMLFGVLAMQASTILSIIEGQRAALGSSVRVAFTGGGAGFLIEALRRSGGTKFDIVYQPTLVHRGLLAAWKAAK
jgi:type III pantothenate kinase